MRRIVLVHTTGAYAGLRRILGTDEGMPYLPPEVENVDFIDHVGMCSLVKVEPKYALYREIPPPVESKAGV